MKKKNDLNRPSIEELQFLQALNSSYRLLLNYGARRIKEMEITMAQAYMLVFLGLHPDMTLEDISKELLLAKSAIHLTLRQLVAGGYIERVPVPHDRRHQYRRRACGGGPCTRHGAGRQAQGRSAQAGDQGRDHLRGYQG